MTARGTYGDWFRGLAPIDQHFSKFHYLLCFLNSLAHGL